MVSLELALARRRVEEFTHPAGNAHDGWVRQSEQAQVCADCEEFLALGISALEWLERCEDALVTGAAEGLIDFTPEMERAIEGMYAAWIDRCDFAEECIALSEGQGFSIDHAAPFRNCRERARDWLERNETYKQSKTAREERLSKEPW